MGTLAVCVVVLALWSSARPLLERLIAVLEARTAHATKAVTPLEEIVVPEDLIRLAKRESEEWAQEQALRAMRDAFRQETGTTEERWARVRLQFRIALMSEGAA
jgi:hypothetical protein